MMCELKLCSNNTYITFLNQVSISVSQVGMKQACRDVSGTANRVHYLYIYVFTATPPSNRVLHIVP